MSAIFSPCGKFRYYLDRPVALNELLLTKIATIVIAFIGCNPSTAGADIDDATTGKWMGFSLRNAARLYLAGNAFAYRATDVRELARAVDPIGPENDTHLASILVRADLVVPCWGSRDKLPRRLRPQLTRVAEQIFASGKPIRVFGLTKSGDPMHPLMLGYDTPLVEWSQAA